MSLQRVMASSGVVFKFCSVPVALVIDAGGGMIVDMALAEDKLE